MAIPGNLTLTTITISSPDPPALARFYARLLGWVTLLNPAGHIFCLYPRE